MKKPFLFVLVLLLLISTANSAVIEVNVHEVLDGKVNGFFINKTSDSGVVKIKTEFDNIGSVSFKARMRMEILEKEKILYTIWSNEKELNPSEKKVFEFFSYINGTGIFNSRIRVYYGGEVLDYENIKFEVKKLKNPSDIFEISRVRASEGHISFDIKSKEDVGNVVIMFSDFPMSWIVEEKEIGNLRKDDKIPVRIKYIPASWLDKEIKVHIFTEDGNFYKTERIILKKDTGVKWIVNNILDFFFGVSRF